jgi:hypothetical protein
MLGNLIRQGLEPFYSASHDARESFRGANSMTTLIAAESEGNRRLFQRDEARVRQARCLVEIGDRDQAVNTLFTALEYITIQQEPLWIEARSMLWELVGYTPD